MCAVVAEAMASIVATPIAGAHNFKEHKWWAWDTIRDITQCVGVNFNTPKHIRDDSERYSVNSETLKLRSKDWGEILHNAMLWYSSELQIGLKIRDKHGQQYSKLSYKNFRTADRRRTQWSHWKLGRVAHLMSKGFMLCRIWV